MRNSPSAFCNAARAHAHRAVFYLTVHREPTRHLVYAVMVTHEPVRPPKPCAVKINRNA